MAMESLKRQNAQQYIYKTKHIGRQESEHNAVWYVSNCSYSVVLECFKWDLNLVPK